MVNTFCMYVAFRIVDIVGDGSHSVHNEKQNKKLYGCCNRCAYFFVSVFVFVFVNCAIVSAAMFSFYLSLK